MTTPNRRPSPPPGLVTGGRGGPDDELLIDGQEEVFSRTEVELGQIEHDTTAGSAQRPESDVKEDTGRDPNQSPAVEPSRRQPAGDR